MPVRPSGNLSHLSQYLLFRGGVLGVQAFSLPLLSFLVCPTPFATIGFGSLNSWFSWASPWAPSTSLTAPSPTVGGPGGEGRGLPRRMSVLGAPLHTDPRLLAGSLPPTQETGLWCLATWPLGNSGLEGSPLDPDPHPDTRHLCAWPGAPEGGDFAASQCPQCRVWHK